MMCSHFEYSEPYFALKLCQDFPLDNLFFGEHFVHLTITIPSVFILLPQTTTFKLVLFFSRVEIPLEYRIKF